MKPILVSTPGHAFSTEHSRVFVLVPPPQVAEHSENGDQSDHFGTNRSPLENVVNAVVVAAVVSASGSFVGSTVSSDVGSTVDSVVTRSVTGIEFVTILVDVEMVVVVMVEVSASEIKYLT